MQGDFANVPIIDVAALTTGDGDRRAVAGQLDRACRECGFFYVVGHGVEKDDAIYCCVHCAKLEGARELRDRA